MKTTTLLSLSAATLSIGLAGCSTSSRNYDLTDVSTKSIMNNMTPEVETLDQRSVDADIALAYYKNHNMRMIREDIGRAMYWDHPSRLSSFPILDVSGKPR